jgi:hypothetical protein
MKITEPSPDYSLVCLKCFPPLFILDNEWGSIYEIRFNLLKSLTLIAR